MSRQTPILPSHGSAEAVQAQQRHDETVRTNHVKMRATLGDLLGGREIRDLKHNADRQRRNATRARHKLTRIKALPPEEAAAYITDYTSTEQTAKD